MTDSRDLSRRLAIGGFGIAGALAAMPALAQGADSVGARRTTRMVKMIITIKRRQGMSHEEFVRYQREVHRPLLMAIPEASKYIRRFVISFPVHAPDYSGPDYDSVVEAWFDSVADMNALYFSENFLKDVSPDHVNFMDLSSYGRIVAEEEVVVG